MPKHLKELRDASIRKLGYSELKSGSEYKLLTSMTDALYVEGHAEGIKDALVLFKSIFSMNPKVEKMFNEVVGQFEERNLENTKIVAGVLKEEEGTKN